MGRAPWSYPHGNAGEGPETAAPCMRCQRQHAHHVLHRACQRGAARAFLQVHSQACDSSSVLTGVQRLALSHPLAPRLWYLALALASSTLTERLPCQPETSGRRLDQYRFTDKHCMLSACQVHSQCGLKQEGGALSVVWQACHMFLTVCPQPPSVLGRRGQGLIKGRCPARPANTRDLHLALRGPPRSTADQADLN